MAVNIHNLIAAINPDTFCQPVEARDSKRINLIKEVKHTAAENGYLAAAAIAKVKASEYLDFEEAVLENPFRLTVLKNPIEKHTLIRDAFSENVTALYFWLLDNLPSQYVDLQQIDKLVDNFASAPGSGHFWDVNSRTIRLQDQALKFLEKARQIAESITTTLTELKELRQRLETGEAESTEAGLSKASSELMKNQFEVKRAGLRQQVDLARLYARWAQPYLRAAQQLEPRASSSAALVHAFNSVLLELVLLGQAEYRVQDDINNGELPRGLARMKMRPCHPLILVEFSFRGVPERPRSGGYLFRGRSEVTLTSYALNEDELNVLKNELEKDELGDLFRSVAGTTDQTLARLQDQLDEFLSDADKKPAVTAAKGQSPSEDTNPFSALLSIFRSPGRPTATSAGNPLVTPDSSVEKVARNQALFKARRECRKFYEHFKIAHGMATLSESGVVT